MPVYDNQYVFLHIPRTGGTIMERALKTKYAATYSDRNSTGFSEQHYTLDKLVFPRFAPKTFVFTFIRNPFDRILSSYLNYAKHYFNGFDSYIQMVQEVVEKKLYLKYPAINTCDTSHFIPMVEMIGTSHVDFIGKFEHFERDIQRLASLSKLECLQKVQIRKNKVHYKQYYSERNRQIVEKLYEQDFKRFQYSF